MASSKLFPFSNSRNSDLSPGSSSSSSSSSFLNFQFLSNRHSRTIDNDPSRNRSHSLSSMTVDGVLRNGYDSNPTDSILLDAHITLVDSSNPTTNSSAVVDSNHNTSSGGPKTADEVWREIVSGERKKLKEEVAEELITLEDFLVKSGVVPVEDVKFPPTERLSGGIFSFDSIPAGSFQELDKVEGSIVGFGNGVDLIGSGRRWKRGRAALEPLDKVAEQRQRRMIKNRESAARSRERKQAYQVELESLAVRLEEENEQLLREKAEKTKERFEQLMEKVIPVVVKRRPPRVVIRRVNSMKW